MEVINKFEHLLENKIFNTKTRATIFTSFVLLTLSTIFWMIDKSTLFSGINKSLMNTILIISSMIYFLGYFVFMITSKNNKR